MYTFSKCPLHAAFAAVVAAGIELTFPVLDATLGVESASVFLSIVFNYYVNLHSSYPIHS